MAKKSIISVVRDGSVMTFTVANAGSFTVDLATLSDEMRDAALEHGVEQKVRDAAAMPKDELTGNAEADALTKFEAMRTVAERITSDDPSWNKRAGEGSGQVAGIILRAFSEYVANMAKKRKTDVPSDEAIRAKYEAMDRKTKLALRNVPEIAKIIERIKSERPAKSVDAVDTDALLSDLGV